MLRNILLIVFGWGLAVTGNAQAVKSPATGVGIVYNRETTFNFRLATNRGMVAGVEWGRLRTYDKTLYFQVNIGELRHTKELRQSADPSVSRSFRPFVYGKQNNLLALRAAWGTKRYYSEKARQKGVAMGLSYSIGPTLGILKPYYLALRYSSNVAGQSRALHERYTEENAAVFLDNSRILGASPFTKGFEEVSFLPGGNASIALHMDWGAFDEFVKAIEIGAMLDVFARPAPILITDRNTQVFLNFFVNLQLGKRR